MGFGGRGRELSGGAPIRRPSKLRIGPRVGGQAELGTKFPHDGHGIAPNRGIAAARGLRLSNYFPLGKPCGIDVLTQQLFSRHLADSRPTLSFAPGAGSDVVPEGSLNVLSPETLGSRVGISLTGGVWGRLPHAWRFF